MRVTVVDYGLGNLWSVRNAFEFVGTEVTVTSDPTAVSRSTCLVLPGVGSFGTGMRNLHARGLVDALREAVIARSAPLLGICLGMQLLADESDEAPGIPGLGWIPGKVERFRDKSLRLPHMGFNAAIATDTAEAFFHNEVGATQDFYFVHSYCFTPADIRHVLARTNYGGEFVSAVRRDRIIGVQFHPEKSQSNGLRLLSAFVRYSSKVSHG